jgi:predicted phosphodiesterase
MKTKHEFFSFLDSIKPSGILPDGKRLGRETIAQYFNSIGVQFQAENGSYPIGSAGMGKWYRQWRKGQVASFTPEQFAAPVSFGLEEDDEFNFLDGETEALPVYEWGREGKILILSDLHIPYHSLSSIRLAIRYGKDQGVNGILLNGDICDFYEVSRHDKDPSKKKVVEEIHLTRAFLAELRRLFPSAKIVYKIGNHETRLERYVMKNAPALQGIEQLQLRELLHMRELDIDCVENNQLLNIGQLAILHGNEFNTGGGGVNVARSLRLKAGANVLFGNFHKTQSDYSTNIHRSIHGGWSVGCLCDLSPKYFPFNNWNHGFAMVELSAGAFKVRNLKIIDGVVS